VALPRPCCINQWDGRTDPAPPASGQRRNQAYTVRQGGKPHGRAYLRAAHPQMPCDLARTTARMGVAARAARWAGPCQPTRHLLLAAQRDTISFRRAPWRVRCSSVHILSPPALPGGSRLCLGEIHGAGEQRRTQISSQTVVFMRSPTQNGPRFSAACCQKSKVMRGAPSHEAAIKPFAWRYHAIGAFKHSIFVNGLSLRRRPVSLPCGCSGSAARYWRAC